MTRRSEPRPGGPGLVAHAAVRGAVAAMTMSGMRVLTQRLGLIEHTPPERVAAHARGALERIPQPQRDGVVVGLHWAFGAVGGATFALLPGRVRRLPWFGPAYGLALWAGFEAVAPLVGLRSGDARRTPYERGALLADHVLYGLVLGELRRRPRE